jgi:membrane protein YqaA with SNARE-associated domain
MRIKPLLARFRKTQKHHQKLYFLVLIFLGFILFLPVFYQLKHQQFRSLGLLGVFLLNFIGSATLFLPTPAFVSVGISAIKSNPLLVAVVGAAGASLGEGTTFLFAYTSNKFFRLEKHSWLKKLKKVILNKWGAFVILFFAFIPNPFFDGIGIVAGLARYPIKKYLFLTFIGRLFRYILIGYIAIYLVYGRH